MHACTHTVHACVRPRRHAPTPAGHLLGRPALGDDDDDDLDIDLDCAEGPEDGAPGALQAPGAPAGQRAAGVGAGARGACGMLDEHGEGTLPARSRYMRLCGGGGCVTSDDEEEGLEGAEEQCRGAGGGRAWGGALQQARQQRVHAGSDEAGFGSWVGGLGSGGGEGGVGGAAAAAAGRCRGRMCELEGDCATPPRSPLLDDQFMGDHGSGFLTPTPPSPPSPHALGGCSSGDLRGAHAAGRAALEVRRARCATTAAAAAAGAGGWGGCGAAAAAYPALHSHAAPCAPHAQPACRSPTPLGTPAWAACAPAPHHAAPFHHTHASPPAWGAAPHPVHAPTARWGAGSGGHEGHAQGHGGSAWAWESEGEGEEERGQAHVAMDSLVTLEDFNVHMSRVRSPQGGQGRVCHGSACEAWPILRASTLGAGTRSDAPTHACATGCRTRQRRARDAAVGRAAHARCGPGPAYAQHADEVGVNEGCVAACVLACRQWQGSLCRGRDLHDRACCC